jgi:hypothetical protein
VDVVHFTLGAFAFAFAFASPPPRAKSAKASRRVSTRPSARWRPRRTSPPPPPPRATPRPRVSSRRRTSRRASASGVRVGRPTRAPPRAPPPPRAVRAVRALSRRERERRAELRVLAAVLSPSRRVGSGSFSPLALAAPFARLASILDASERGAVLSRGAVRPRASATVANASALLPPTFICFRFGRRVHTCTRRANRASLRVNARRRIRDRTRAQSEYDTRVRVLSIRNMFIGRLKGTAINY